MWPEFIQYRCNVNGERGMPTLMVIELVVDPHTGAIVPAPEVGSTHHPTIQVKFCLYQQFG